MTDKSISEHEDEQLEESIVAELIRTAANPQPMPEAMKARLAASFADCIEQQRQQQPAEQAQSSRWLKHPALAPLLVAASAFFAFLLWPAPQITITPESHSIVNSVIGVSKIRQADGERALHSGSSLFTGDRLHTLSNGLVSLQFRAHQIRVNAETTLELTADGVKLFAGQIYVDESANSHQSGAAMIVETEFGSVTDIGTQFMVTISANSNAATVRQGIIQVTNSTQTVIAEATPDHAQRIDLSADTLDPHPTSGYGTEWNWIQDLASHFSLNGRTVNEYLVWVSQETGLGIHYSNAQVQSAASQIRLSGELNSKSRPADSLEQVLATTSLEHAISDDGVILINVRK